VRQRAQQAAKLAFAPQQDVVTTTDNDQPMIEIVPADPAVMFVPVYDPAWVWGPPLWYPYPGWDWGGAGFGFGIGIDVGWCFGGRWNGWGGWGWHPGWRNHTVIVNNTFIHQNNFNGGRFSNAHGSAVWEHDPGHRVGVPYSRPEVNSRYRDSVRQSVSPRAIPEGARSASSSPERFGNREIPRSSPSQENRGAFGGMEHGSAAATHAEHGYSSMGPARSSPGFSAPRSAPAPRGGGGRH